VPSTSFWASAVVGVQPAAATKPTSSKPLKESAEYAFVVTNGIVGAADQQGLGRPTLANVLLFSNPIWVAGKSQLAGVSDAQAKALQRVRVQIANLLANLGA